MTKEEAREFLEGLDFCMKHLVAPQKKAGSRKSTCPSCDLEAENLKAAKIQRAVMMLRDEGDPAGVSEEWLKCSPGSLPPDGKRVYFICIGFVEKLGRAGGKEHFTTGKPMFWKFMDKPH